MARRVDPHSLEAEASVIGAILLRNEVLALVGELEPQAFHHPGHRTVFEAICELDQAGQPIDPVTLEDRLRNRGKLEAIGGLAFLSQLALRVPTADNVEHYARIVQEKYGVRSLILALSEALELGYRDYGDLSAYQAEVQAKVSSAIVRGTRTGPRLARQLTKDLALDLERRYESPDGITGVPTGYAALDGHLAGLQPTDLIILAARTSMGKSALALCIAKNAAERGYPVVFFSLEMSALQLMERMLCSAASVSTAALRRGSLQRQQFAAIGSSLPRLSDLPLAIDETPDLSHHDIRARVRAFAAQHGGDRLGLVVVDYLQLMRGASRYGTREQEISESSRGLKAIAKGLGWPVLALSQLNRNLESRSNKRPQL